MERNAHPPPLQPAQPRVAPPAPLSAGNPPSYDQAALLASIVVPILIVCCCGAVCGCLLRRCLMNRRVRPKGARRLEQHDDVSSEDSHDDEYDSDGASDITRSDASFSESHVSLSRITGSIISLQSASDVEMGRGRQPSLGRPGVTYGTLGAPHQRLAPPPPPALPINAEKTIVFSTTRGNAISAIARLSEYSTENVSDLLEIIRECGKQFVDDPDDLERINVEYFNVQQQKREIMWYDPILREGSSLQAALRAPQWNVLVLDPDGEQASTVVSMQSSSEVDVVPGRHGQQRHQAARLVGVQEEAEDEEWDEGVAGSGDGEEEELQQSDECEEDGLLFMDDDDAEDESVVSATTFFGTESVVSAATFYAEAAPLAVATHPPCTSGGGSLTPSKASATQRSNYEGPEPSTSKAVVASASKPTQHVPLSKVQEVDAVRQTSDSDESESEDEEEVKSAALPRGRKLRGKRVPMVAAKLDDTETVIVVAQAVARATAANRAAHRDSSEENEDIQSVVLAPPLRYHAGRDRLQVAPSQPADDLQSECLVPGSVSSGQETGSHEVSEEGSSSTDAEDYESLSTAIGCEGDDNEDLRSEFLTPSIRAIPTGLSESSSVGVGPQDGGGVTGPPASTQAGLD